MDLFHLCSMYLYSCISLIESINIQILMTWDLKMVSQSLLVTTNNQMGEQEQGN